SSRTTSRPRSGRTRCSRASGSRSTPAGGCTTRSSPRSPSRGRSSRSPPSCGSMPGPSPRCGWACRTWGRPHCGPVPRRRPASVARSRRRHCTRPRPRPGRGRNPRRTPRGRPSTADTSPGCSPVVPWRRPPGSAADGLDAASRQEEPMTATRMIDLNADGGESFGRWELGADTALAPLISSINVACGWHAGDPGTMTRTVALAREHDISVGAHPGFPDLTGFGRRAMAFSPDEAAQAVLYQAGALRAIADRAGVAMRHVKPHGSLYGLLMKDDDAADAVADAVGGMDPDLFIVLEAGPCAERQRERGHKVAAEAFADLEYTDDGHIIIDP